jgi:hypothetical protein
MVALWLGSRRRAEGNALGDGASACRVGLATGRRRRTQDVGSMGRLAGALRMRRQANMSDKLDSALHLRI